MDNLSKKLRSSMNRVTPQPRNGLTQNADTERNITISSPRASGNLIVITGPSGVGKGTVVERLLATVPNLKRSVSVTTREKRPNEVEQVDYFFRSADEFERLNSENAFLEWAEFAGGLYGTPHLWVTEQLKAGIDVILEIEVQGAKQVKLKVSDAVLVFLSPPSFEALEARLRNRATETPEKLSMRLAKAKQELTEKQLFHYEVVNDVVDQAVDNLVHIVYSERCRIKPLR
jgi:guanylate kinase